MTIIEDFMCNSILYEEWYFVQLLPNLTDREGCCNYEGKFNKFFCKCLYMKLSSHGHLILFERRIVIFWVERDMVPQIDICYVICMVKLIISTKERKYYGIYFTLEVINPWDHLGEGDHLDRFNSNSICNSNQFNLTIL